MARGISNDPFKLGSVAAERIGSEVASTARGARKGRKRDDSGEREFLFQCVSRKLPTPEQQFKLLKTVQKPRKDGKNIPSRWFFDFAWPQYKLIVEIDGGVWTGGAHGHPLDLTRNMAKRNDAALADFVVLAFTPQQVKKGEAIQFTIRTLYARGWKMRND